MAIGMGWILPCVMSTRSCATALPANPTKATARTRSMATRNKNADLAIVNNGSSSSPAEHQPRVEIQNHSLRHQSNLLRREYVAVGRALDDSAPGGVGGRHEARIEADPQHLRLGG